MTFTVIWGHGPIDAGAGFLRDDPAGLAGLLDSVDRLADDPWIAASSSLGAPDLRRLRAGRYRVIYRVDRAAGTVSIRPIGRVTR